jgi:hypothetical protein
MAAHDIHPDVHADDDAPLEQPVSDPITGTRPAGPITPGSARGHNWSVAARWFILAILFFLFGLALYWFYGQ